MSRIVVSEEQAALITASNNALQVRDSQGRLIGYVTPALTADELANLKARIAANEPTYTTAEVLEHLRSLEQR